MKNRILPQTSKKITQIYLPYLWHYATLEGRLATWTCGERESCLNEPSHIGGCRRQPVIWETSRTTWKTCNLGVTWKTCKTLHQHMKTYRTYWRLSSPTRKKSQNCYQVDIIIAANSCLTLIKTPQHLHHKIATSSFALLRVACMAVHGPLHSV